MNKVFLSGTLRRKPETVYTPKGERLVMFPLWVHDGAFSIDVVFVDQQGSANLADMGGGSITVSGMLTRVSSKPHDHFRLNANKIIRMEE